MRGTKLPSHSPKACIPRILAFRLLEEAHNGCVEGRGNPIKSVHVPNLADNRKNMLVAINLNFLREASPRNDVWLAWLILLEDEQLTLLTASHVVSAGQILLLACVHSGEHNSVQVILILTRTRSLH